MNDLKLENIISGHKINEDDAAWLRAALAAQGVPADSDIDALWEKAATVGIGNMATYLQAREFAKLLLASAPPQAQQAAEVTLPPIPCHPEPHSHRWSKLEEATIKAYGGLCAIVAQAATKAAPAQAQQAAPLTDEQIEAIGHRKAWRYKHSSDPAHSSTYTFNRVCLLDFARAAIDAARGIGASSGSAP
jgi:hypothetical protein